MRNAVLAALLAVACTSPVAQQSSSEPPAKSPDIRGTVTHVAANEIRVEADPQASHGAKAVVKITDTTTIHDASGKPVDASSIHEGQRLRVWFDGAVAQSYPLQATASRIEIE